MAIVENIEYLHALANHPRTSESERRRIEEAIAKSEQVLRGQTRIEIYQEYVEFLTEHLDGEWGSRPQGREYLLRTLADCRAKLAAERQKAEGATI